MKSIRRILEISAALSEKVITEKIFNKKSDKSLNDKIDSLSKESGYYKNVVKEYDNQYKVYKELRQIEGFNENRAWKKVKGSIDSQKRAGTSRTIFAETLRYSVYLTVAASVLLCILLYRGDISFEWLQKGVQSKSLIVPDPGKSFVVTSGGNVHYLDYSKETIDITTIVKASEVNSINKFDFSALNLCNTIMVPYGTTCSVKMSDGTQIRLNSGSLLRFPSEFSGDTREVTLTGEAYFDVAHNPQKPFIVNTSRFSVKVLGTSFNISCYNDEKSAKVSLERGSVKVLDLKGTEYATLLPDQQLCLDSDGRARIIDVNTPMVTSWKDGVFIFDNESLEEITKKLEKFYNINIVIKDENVKTLHYYAYFKRYQNPTDVFDILRMTKEIDYSVENNVLTIFSNEKNKENF